MPRVSLTLIAGVGALLCGCASVGWHTYAQAPRERQLAADGVKRLLICRDLQPTGTKLIEHACHTQAEWDSIADANLQQFNQDAARALPSTDPGSAAGR